MRFREVIQMNEARPRPWRGDMKTRLRDKAMPDAMGADMARKSAREAMAAKWQESIEDENVFADEIVVGKLDSWAEICRQKVTAGKQPWHFSWRVGKDCKPGHAYKITIRIKGLWEDARPSEDTEKLWKKIKTECKQMLQSNGIEAHGVKVVPGGYIVCAWSLHNFEPAEADEQFTREDLVKDIMTGIESIAMVAEKWAGPVDTESHREFSSMGGEDVVAESIDILTRNGYRIIDECGCSCGKCKKGKKKKKAIKESMTSDDDYYTSAQEVVDSFKAMPIDELLTELSRAGYDVDSNDVEYRRDNVVAISTWLDMSDDGDDSRNIVFYGFVSGDDYIKLQDYSMDESVQSGKKVIEEATYQYESEGEKLDIVFDLLSENGLDDDTINDLLDNIDDKCPGWEMMEPDEIFDELMYAE